MKETIIDLHNTELEGMYTYNLTVFEPERERIKNQFCAKWNVNTHPNRAINREMTETHEVADVVACVSAYFKVSASRFADNITIFTDSRFLRRYARKSWSSI
eukprot:TRINITY_DN17152_c0_g1_i1.p2 TRINITY_DN17152_c0_g1~~TRINITY_DN17152_c0_g1_i1.p2  ORF type:complete len:102 (-),score=10.40 TRINITY_DN17152_c0_g1_i1:156-461(-)